MRLTLDTGYKSTCFVAEVETNLISEHDIAARVSNQLVNFVMKDPGEYSDLCFATRRVESANKLVFQPLSTYKQRISLFLESDMIDDVEKRSINPRHIGNARYGLRRKESLTFGKNA